MKRIFFILIGLFCFGLAPSQDVESLLNRLNNTTADSAKIPIYIDLSAICDLSDIPEYTNKGLQLVEKELSKNSNSRYHLNQKAELMSNLAFYYGEKADTLRQDSISRITLIIHSKTGNRKGTASVLNNMGYSYTIRGNYVKAIEYYKKSLDILQQLKDDGGLALRYNNIGDIYLRLGMFKDALAYMQMALKSYDKLNDLAGQALVCTNLSNAHLIQSNLKDAEKYALRAIGLNRKIKPMVTTGTIYHNYGAVLHKKGEFINAKAYLDTALRMKKKFSADREWITTYASIGLIYQDEKNSRMALQYFDSALHIAERIQVPLEISQQLTYIAQVHFDAKEYTQAIEKLDRAFQIALKIKSRLELSQICLLRARTCAATGNKNEGYQWMELYSGYKDSLFNEKTKEIAIRKSLEYEQNIKQEKDSLQNASLLKEAELQRLKERSEEEKGRQWLYMGIIFMLAIAFILIIGFIRKSQINKIILKEKRVIENQKNIIETQRNEIVDSINYARRMQRAILPSNEFLKNIYPESFVFYKPKDQLSGDFYYAATVTASNDEQFDLFAIADCTGHGVPGGLMSIVGVIYLQLGKNMPQINSPAEALDLLNKGVHRIFTKDEDGQLIRDGMDIVMGAIRKSDLKLFYAAAKNSIYIVRNKQIIELRGNRFPVGRGESEEPEPFTKYEFQLMKGDIIYASTDGFADQFGGVNGKKYKYKPMMDFLISIHATEMAQQKKELENEFLRWKGDQDQVDDICIVGIKI